MKSYIITNCVCQKEEVSINSSDKFFIRCKFYLLWENIPRRWLEQIEFNHLVGSPWDYEFLLKWQFINVELIEWVKHILCLQNLITLLNKIRCQNTHPWLLCHLIHGYYDKVVISQRFNVDIQVYFAMSRLVI